MKVFSQYHQRTFRAIHGQAGALQVRTFAHISAHQLLYLFPQGRSDVGVEITEFPDLKIKLSAPIFETFESSLKDIGKIRESVVTLSKRRRRVAEEADQESDGE